jgi:hypothetical protein
MDTEKIKKELRKRKDPICDMMADNITPQSFQQARDEDIEYRRFIGERVKSMPEPSNLERELGKLAFKLKTGVPTNEANEVLIDAIRTDKIPNAASFKHLIPHEKSTLELRRQALDRFIKEAQFQVAGSDRQLIDRCTFVSLYTPNDHNKLCQRAQHTAWEIFSIPISWNQTGGLWCFYINDLVRYIAENKNKSPIPFPGKQYIRRVYRHLVDYIPDILAPEYIPHIYRWHASSQKLNQQLQTNQLGLEEINSLRELGGSLNIGEILNQTNSQEDRHNVYHLPHQGSWKQPKPSKVYNFIMNTFEMIQQNQWVIRLIKAMMCCFNLYYFLAQVMKGVTDHRIWRIVLQAAFGTFWLDIYNVFYQLGVKDESQIIGVLAEVARLRTSAASWVSTMGFFFIRMFAPVWAFWRLFFRQAADELQNYNPGAFLWKLIVGPSNIHHQRASTFLSLMHMLFDTISSIIHGLVVNANVFYFNIGTTSYDNYLGILSFMCKTIAFVCKFIYSATINYFGVAYKKITDDTGEEISMRYNEYWGAIDHAKQGFADVAGNAVSIGAVTDMFVPGLGTGLSVANGLRNSIKHVRQMEHDQSARLNSKMVDYAKNTYQVAQKLNDADPSLSDHQLCQKIFTLLQKAGTLFGTIATIGDIYSNGWFLKTFWDEQPVLQRILTMRIGDPNYTYKSDTFITDDKKSVYAEAEKYLDGGYGCIGLYNISYKHSGEMGSIDMQDVHNPEYRRRIHDIYTKSREETKRLMDVDKKTYNEAIVGGIKHVLGITNDKGFTKDHAQMETNFRLLSEYDIGRQFLMFAKMAGVSILGADKKTDMIDKQLASIPEFGYITSLLVGGPDVFVRMIANLLQVGDPAYMSGIAQIFQDLDTESSGISKEDLVKKYGKSIENIIGHPSTDVKGLGNELRKIQIVYVDKIINDEKLFYRDNVYVAPPDETRTLEYIVRKTWQGIDRWIWAYLSIK